MQFFETITINFITNILFARNLYIKKINNTILILINKLIKYTIYIATIKKLNTKYFAKFLLKEFVYYFRQKFVFYKLFLINRLIVGSGFGSNFWNRFNSTVSTLEIDPKSDSVSIILKPNRFDPTRFSVSTLEIESNRQERQEY